MTPLPKHPPECHDGGHMRTVCGILFLTALAGSLSGCLKTRTQLKEDGDGPSQPVPAQVQEVQPQGQYVIDEIKGEITRLSGRVEDVERSQKQQAGQASAANQEELKKVSSRIIELENAQAQMLETIKKLQASIPPPNVGEYFDKGKTLFAAGNHTGAIDAFTTYLSVPKGRHAEEATYLRGECFLQLKQFKKAIGDFSVFPERFTASKRMPAALLKIGESFEALGMKDDARTFYQELTEKYPKTAEAKKARARLK